MHSSTGIDTQPLFEDFEPELSGYLAQRFASEDLARKIVDEARRRLGDGEILSLVGDPGCICAASPWVLVNNYWKTKTCRYAREFYGQLGTNGIKRAC